MAILTISRRYGSGGRDIGHAVADLLHFEYVDRKRILDDIGKAGQAWGDFAKQYDEKQPSVYERYKWSFRGFVALNQAQILDYALQDNMVIMGRGGNFLLRGIPFAFRIHLKASVDDRIERLIKREGIDSGNARWLIEKVDKEMAGAVYLIYGSAWDDPKQYDRVFDTSTQNAGEIVTAVKDELLKRASAGTEKARQVLQLRALAAKVRARIAIEPTFPISSLDVRPKEEGLIQYGIIVRGVVYNKSAIGPIQEAAKKICGEVPVEFELQYRWHPRLGEWHFR
ncbi:MAG: cytidylate kinase-like family protein [Deltaproteobacteria bacterium]|nr:cytidylate kinase-like family protein [Deltaproteobacteria bacterium]